MLSLRRVVVAGVIAVPMVLGSAGVALADSFEGHEEVAGPGGASSEYVAAHEGWGHFGHHGGGASYADVSSSAGPEGATSEWVFAVVDGYGDVVFHQGQDTAGPQGVSSSGVSAASGHHHHHG